MNVLKGLLVIGLAPALAAQSPLTTIFAATHSVGGPFGGAVFFNLTVNTTITVSRLDINTASAPGLQGTVRLYRTVAPLTTFSGSEQVPANWTLLATGTAYAAGLDTPTPACFQDPVTLTPGTAGYAVVLVGLQHNFTPGNGANQNYSTAELTLNAGAAAQIGPWYPEGVVQPFLGNAFNPYVWNGSIHYTLGTSAPRCSYNDEYGAGCGSRFASFFELFETPAQASAKLPGRSVTWIPDAYPGVTRYSVLQTPGALIDPTTHTPLTSFTTSIPGAIALDDGEAVVAVPGAGFAHPGGTANSLVVHTNGIVSVASNLAWLEAQPADDWAPLVPALLDATSTAWYSWHDFDLSGTGGGQIRIFDTGTAVVITWLGVESPPAGAGNPSTFQFVFDYTTGSVTLTWDSIAAAGLGGNYAGDPYLVGYSPSGANLRPESEVDLGQDTVFDLATPADELPSLKLVCSGRPVIGQSVTYTTSNERGTPVGVFFASVADLPGISPVGLDLGFAGAPGCVINLDISVVWSTVITSPGGTTFTLVLDPTFLGLEMYLQSAWLDGAANALGIITSNALAQLCQVN